MCVWCRWTTKLIPVIVVVDEAYDRLADLEVGVREKAAENDGCPVGYTRRSFVRSVRLIQLEADLDQKSLDGKHISTCWPSSGFDSSRTGWYESGGDYFQGT